MTRLSRLERYDWIVDYIHANQAVDICDSTFVDAYIVATNATHRVRMWGAAACPRLSSDLYNLWRLNRVTRQTIGLPGMAGLGFPRWVYSYSLGVMR